LGAYTSLERLACLSLAADLSKSGFHGYGCLATQAICHTPSFRERVT
jgi:hypothetical protein